jgi:hypothetical protein
MTERGFLAVLEFQVSVIKSSDHLLCISLPPPFPLHCLIPKHLIRCRLYHSPPSYFIGCVKIKTYRTSRISEPIKRTICKRKCVIWVVCCLCACYVDPFVYCGV